MPVDLVLAISHNRLVRQREWQRRRQINKDSIGIGYYDAISKDNHKTIDKDKDKDKTCLEIFKIW
jgi:hypothetical protein